MSKTVLITGANRGIGFATAKKFYEESCNVILAGRNLQKITEAAARIDPRRCRGIVWDVARISSNEAVLDEAHTYFGDIDTFVNNAGILSREDMDENYRSVGFLNKTEAGWDEVMNTNLKGAFFAIQAEARYMVRQGIRGHIVNLCSEVAFMYKDSMYTISKWGVRCMTGGLAPELAAHGIVMNAVAPGETSTEILYQTENVIFPNNSPRGVRALPCEIANTIYFLANDPNIIGATLLSDGGHSLIPV